MAKKEQIKKSFGEVNHALLQAQSLVNIGQESSTDSEHEDMYNLLGVASEKIAVVQEFFDNNESALDNI